LPVARPSMLRMFGVALVVALLFLLAVIFLGQQVSGCACPVPAGSFEYAPL
jgi:hypothetical protein